MIIYFRPCKINQKMEMKLVKKAKNLKPIKTQLIKTER